MNTSAPQLTDPKALARQYARASTFFLHQEVAQDVHERLSLVNKAFTAAAVITPFPLVWHDFPKAVANAPLLALASDAHDLIIHGLCLHWADDPVGQLIQCRRALRPDGLLIAALFGGQTLAELRACLAEAEAEITGGLSPRVLPMAEIRDLGALLQRAGFALPVADSHKITVDYADVAHLMRDLRAMGESNAMHARPRHFTRRNIFLRAAEIYKNRFTRADGRITATFEIIYLTGWAPHDSQQKPLRPGSAAHSLAQALKTDEIKLP